MNKVSEYPGVSAAHLEVARNYSSPALQVAGERDAVALAVCRALREPVR